jgi:hypothetical protein
MPTQEQYIGKLVIGAVWDDLRVPFTSTKLGALDKPDFDDTNVGFLFPQNDATEVLRFVAQIPHLWVAETALVPHVHWQQSAATAVLWKLDYKIIPPGAAVPANFTTLSGDSGLFTYTAGDLHQKTPLGTIDMAGVTGVSSVILGKVYREDNTTTGDVLAWEMDFHYLRHRLGSDTEGG